MDRRRGCLVLLAVLALAAGCGPSRCACEAREPAAPAPPGRGDDMTPTEQPTSIGSATMEKDGTIVLQLRAQSGPTIGDAQFTYPPTHPQYGEILSHVGGLKPGESKPVPPWPDEE